MYVHECWLFLKYVGRGIASEKSSSILKLESNATYKEDTGMQKNKEKKDDP